MTKELTGYPSIDKPWLKWHKKEYISLIPNYKNIYDYFLETVNENKNFIIDFYGKKYYKQDIKMKLKNI